MAFKLDNRKCLIRALSEASKVSWIGLELALLNNRHRVCHCTFCAQPLAVCLDLSFP